MSIKRIPLVLAFMALFITSFNASAAVECAPQVLTLLTTDATYKQLNSILAPEVNPLKARLNAVKDQATYQTLLTYARGVIATLVNGRLLITLPDGTVVVDTGKADDPTNTLPQGNSYQHFKDKTVNENHNSRIAVLDSQLHVCGVGVETKISTSDGTKESYVAKRLGAYLNSSGTARLSVKQ